jgi:hypothetical protein
MVPTSSRACHQVRSWQIHSVHQHPAQPDIRQVVQSRMEPHVALGIVQRRTKKKKKPALKLLHGPCVAEVELVLLHSRLCFWPVFFIFLNPN